jgi:RNA polymerase sigma-70 factor (ECF subfamily)
MTPLAAIAPAAAPSDVELVQRAAAGDMAAFETMMRKHNRMLFRAARSILRSDVEAEDALQEAYLQAYQSLHRFRGDAQLSTWLTRIVINEALGRLRRHRREGRLMDHDNVVDLDQTLQTDSARAETDDPEASAMRGELRKLLESRIDHLPAAFRTVFVLRAIEELSVEETAACLGIAEATVRSRFFRARSLLRESLEHTFDLALQGSFAFAGARCDRVVAAVLKRLAAAHPVAGPPG